MKKSMPLVICVLMLFVFSYAPAYCKESVQGTDVETRIEALLKKMTLQEKIGQMTQFSEGVSPIELEAMTHEQKAERLQKDRSSREAVKDLARKGLLGSMLNSLGAAHNNELQRVAVEESRLHIPIIYGYDVIHGYRTTFPVPLAMAASWNPDILEKAAHIAAVEASAEGIHWTFSPMVDIARDPRWGRMAEGSGEDTYLGSVMARAQVRGYQGKDLAAPGSIAACAKHYVGYGAAIAGRDYNTTEIPERSLREFYLPPFKAAVDEGAATLMSAFNDLDGIPASGNHYTLTTILRGEWKFSGFVVSDWEAVAQLIPHGFAADRAEAGSKAAIAGVDMDMADGIYLECFPRLVKEGKIPEAVIDEAVRRILRIKFRKGLFERPYTDATIAPRVILTKEHKDAALAAAHESMVLLKNEHTLLPLGGDVPSLAVIGPMADDRKNLLGCWYSQGREEDNSSILQEIRKKVGHGVTVTYAQGCPIENAAQDGIESAVKAARQSKVAIMVLGDSGDNCGEAASKTCLDLPGSQQKLLEAVVATGTPVVLVILNGKPMTIEWAAAHVPSILEAWYPGTMGAQAVADVLFGDYNPGGRLPVSWPRNIGQIPIYYNCKNTGRPIEEKNKFTSKYLDSPNSPLFSFGHGLSYTDFSYGDLNLSSKRIARCDRLTVSVNVKNIGKRAGDEVVQLYIHNPAASTTRPVKELRGFHRIHLEAGEVRKVSFELTPDSFALWNAEMKYVIEPGNFKIQVGGSSEKGLSTTVEVQ
jgi:beta-glucosidase